MMPPFMPPQKPPRPPFVKKGFHLVCSACDLEERYCRCAERVLDAPANDGAESQLGVRIAEAMAKARG